MYMVYILDQIHKLSNERSFERKAVQPLEIVIAGIIKS